MLVKQKLSSEGRRGERRGVRRRGEDEERWPVLMDTQTRNTHSNKRTARHTHCNTHTHTATDTL